MKNKKIFLYIFLGLLGFVMITTNPQKLVLADTYDYSYQFTTNSQRSYVDFLLQNDQATGNLKLDAYYRLTNLDFNINGVNYKSLQIITSSINENGLETLPHQDDIKIIAYKEAQPLVWYMVPDENNYFILTISAYGTNITWTGDNPLIYSNSNITQFNPLIYGGLIEIKSTPGGEITPDPTKTYEQGYSEGYDAGYSSGYSSGTADTSYNILNNPNNYNLYTPEQLQQQYNEGYGVGVHEASIYGYKPIVNFNQLINMNTNIDNTNYSINANGQKIIFDNKNINSSYFIDLNNIDFVSNHQYYFRYKPNNDLGENLNTFIYFYVTDYVTLYKNHNDTIYNSLSDTNATIRLACDTSTNDLEIYLNLFDLTIMYGAGNEPTIEQCRQIFTSDNYLYNESVIINIGYENGVNAGYQEGIAFQKAISGEAGKNTFVTIFESIGSFFAIELFPGVSFGLLIGIPFVISVAWVVIRLFRGGGN